jgi:hypothetical protein
MDLEQHLARPGLRLGELFDRKVLEWTELVNHDRAHDAPLPPGTRRHDARKPAPTSAGLRIANQRHDTTYCMPRFRAT